jgi:hypothetical protein
MFLDATLIITVFCMWALPSSFCHSGIDGGGGAARAASRVEELTRREALRKNLKSETLI